MQRGGAAAVTYDQEFIAVRHESDLLTPLFHAPLVSLSVRELGYVGAFVICAMLSFTGSAPPSLAAAGLVLAAAAFFRWRGEMPEMYLYYAALALLSAPAGKKGQRGRRARADAGRRGRRGRPVRGPLAAILGRPAGGEEGAARAVAGPGAEHVLGSGAGTGGAAGRRRGGGGGGGDAGAPVERIAIAAGGAPVDLSLDIGAARGHAGVAVLVDGAELVRDTANGEGLLTVTLIPRAGLRRIEVLDAAGGGAIASHTVEFVDAAAGGGGGAAGGKGGGAGDGP